MSLNVNMLTELWVPMGLLVTSVSNTLSQPDNSIYQSNLSKSGNAKLRRKSVIFICYSFIPVSQILTTDSTDVTIAIALVLPNFALFWCQLIDLCRTWINKLLRDPWHTQFHLRKKISQTEFTTELDRNRKLNICIVNNWNDHTNNYTNPGYGLSLVDTLWNAGSYRQPLEQEGNPMT